MLVGGYEWGGVAAKVGHRLLVPIKRDYKLPICVTKWKWKWKFETHTLTNQSLSTSIISASISTPGDLRAQGRGQFTPCKLHDVTQHREVIMNPGAQSLNVSPVFLADTQTLRLSWHQPWPHRTPSRYATSRTTRRINHQPNNGKRHNGGIPQYP